MNCSNLTDADLAAAIWPDLFEGMTGPLNTSAPQGAHQNSLTRDHFTADTSLNETVFAPTPTMSMGASTTQANYPYPNDADAWAMLAQDPIAPQPVGDPRWTGVSPYFPYVANSAAATPNLAVSPSSSAAPLGSQDGLSWPFGPGQSIYHPTSFSFGGGSEGTLVVPEFGTNISGGTTYPVGWGTNEVAWSIPAAPETSATAAPGKRRRDESHGDRVPVVMNSREMPPQKRVRGGKANGILKTARSATRTRHKPVARIPKSKINNEPKQPVRGAERLATQDSQGLHHRSLLGPSLQQGWAEEAADGQLIWVEGSVEEMAHRTGSTVQQQQHQQEEVQQESFKIPRNLKMGCQALLVATQADWARGAVREIRCRLCPAARFKKWRQFKRHCESTERHPLSIYFCKYCGDYFARSDVCRRHCRERPQECLDAESEDADAKRRATQREHDKFIRRLKEYLTTGGEDIGMWFSDTIKDMFPNSSKKRIRGSRE